MNKVQIENRLRREGFINIGYHYILNERGDLTEGLPENAVADPTLPDHTTRIQILVTCRYLTSANRFTLNQFTHEKNLPILNE